MKKLCVMMLLGCICVSLLGCKAQKDDFTWMDCRVGMTEKEVNQVLGMDIDGISQDKMKVYNVNYTMNGMQLMGASALFETARPSGGSEGFTGQVSVYKEASAEETVVRTTPFDEDEIASFVEYFTRNFGGPVYEDEKLNQYTWQAKGGIVTLTQNRIIYQDGYNWEEDGPVTYPW